MYWHGHGVLEPSPVKWQVCPLDFSSPSDLPRTDKAVLTALTFLLFYSQ